MADNKIKIGLDVSADTSQAKKSIEGLIDQLDKLSSKDRLKGQVDGMTKELHEAQQAATHLKVGLEQAFNVNTGRLDMSKFAAQMINSGQTASSLKNNLSKLGTEGQLAFNKVAASVVSAEIPMMKMGPVLDKLWGSLKNVATWQISTAIFTGLTSSISEAFRYAEDLNKSLNNIRIVTGYSTDQMADFAKQANVAAQALSTTTTAYTDAALIYYQQGLQGDDVIERTNTTVKMANVTGDSVEKVSNQLTAIWNNFYDGSESLEHYADVMTALGAATASSTDEIAQGIEKFAATGKTVGLSYEYAAAALATVTATTRQSADVVGTAFKTIFARMEDLKLGKTLEDDTDMGKYSSALAAVGVNIKDASGSLKDMDDILDETAEKWGNLDRAQKVALAQTVSGVRQYTQFMALMDNWDFMEQNLQTAEASEGELTKQSKIYDEGWQGATKRVKAALEEIYQDLLDDKFLVQIINDISKIINFIDTIIKGAGGLKGLLATISTTVLAIANSSGKLTNNLANGLQKLSLMTPKGRARQEAMQDDYIQAMYSGGSGTIAKAATESLQKSAKQYYDWQKKYSDSASEWQKQEVEAWWKKQQAIHETLLAAEEDQENFNRDIEQTENRLKKLADSVQQTRTVQAGKFAGGGKDAQAIAAKDIPSDSELKSLSLSLGDESKVAKAIGDNQKLTEQRQSLKQLIDDVRKAKQDYDNDLNDTAAFDTFSKGLDEIRTKLKSFQTDLDHFSDEAKEAADNFNNALNDLKNNNRLAGFEGFATDELSGIQVNKENFEEYQQTVQRTKDILKDLGASESEISNIFQQVDAALENVNGTSDLTDDKINAINDANYQLQESYSNLDLSINDTEESLRQYGATLGLNEQQIENLISAQTQQRESIITTGQHYKKTKQDLENPVSKDPFQDVAKSAMAATQAIAGVNQVTSGAIGIFDTLTDETLSDSEKITAAISGLTSFAGGLVSTIQAISTVGGLMSPAGIAIAAISAAIAIFNVVAKAVQENIEKAKKAAEEAQQTFTKIDDEIKQNNELVKSYSDLMQQYKDGEDVKSDLDIKTRELCEAYGVEGSAIAEISGQYKDYNKILDQVIEKQKQEKKEARDAAEIAAQKEAISANIQHKRYTGFYGTLDVGAHTSGDLIGGFGADDVGAIGIAQGILSAKGINTQISSTKNAMWMDTGDLSDAKQLTKYYEALYEIQTELAKSEQYRSSSTYSEITERLGQLQESYELIKKYQDVIDIYDIEYGDKGNLLGDIKDIKSLKDFNKWEDDARKKAQDAGYELKDLDTVIKTLVTDANNADFSNLFTLSKAVKEIQNRTNNNSKLHVEKYFKNDNYDNSILAGLNWESFANDKDIEKAYKEASALNELNNKVTQLTATSEAAAEALKGFKDGMSAKELQEYTEGISWGENGIISLDDFLNKSDEAQKEYLESLTESSDAYREKEIAANAELLEEQTKQYKEALEKQKSLKDDYDKAIMQKEKLNRLLKYVNATDEERANYTAPDKANLEATAISLGYDFQGNDFTESLIKSKDSLEKKLGEVEVPITAYTNNETLIESTEKAINEVENTLSIELRADISADVTELGNQTDNLVSMYKAIASGATSAFDEAGSQVWKFSREAIEAISKIYPEIMDQAQVLADGTFSVNDEILKNYIDTSDGIVANDRTMRANLLLDQAKELEAKAEQDEEAAEFLAGQQINNQNDLNRTIAKLNNEDHETAYNDLTSFLSQENTIEEQSAKNSVGTNAKMSHAMISNLALVAQASAKIWDPLKDPTLSPEKASEEVLKAAQELTKNLDEVAGLGDKQSSYAEFKFSDKQLEQQQEVQNKVAELVQKLKDRAELYRSSANKLKIFASKLLEDPTGSSKSGKEASLQDIAEAVADRYKQLEDQIEETKKKTDEYKDVLDSTFGADSQGLVDEYLDGLDAIADKYEELSDLNEAFVESDKKAAEEAINNLNTQFGTDLQTQDYFDQNGNFDTYKFNEDVRQAQSDNGLTYDSEFKDAVKEAEDAVKTYEDSVKKAKEIQDQLFDAKTKAETEKYNTAVKSLDGAVEELQDSLKELERQQKKTDKAIEKANKDISKSFGQDKINAIEKYSEALEDQNKELEQQKETYKKIGQESTDTLERILKSANQNIQLAKDENGIVENGFEIQENIRKQLYTAQEEYFKAVQSGDEVAIKEAKLAIDTLEALFEAIKQVIDISNNSQDKIEETTSKQLDNLDDIQSKYYERIIEKLNYNLKLIDNELKLIDYDFKKLSSNFYTMGEAAGLFMEKGEQYLSKLQEYQDTFNELNDANKEQMINQKDYMEGLQTVFDGMLDSLGSILDLDAEVKAYYGQTLSAAKAELENYLKVVNQGATTLKHYESIMKMIGRETDYASLGKIYEGMAANARQQYEISKQWYEQRKADADELFEEMNRYEKTSASYEILHQQWVDAMNEADSAYQDMISKFEDYTQAFVTMYQNTLNMLSQELENKLTNNTSFDSMIESLNRLEKVEEEYLTKTNQIYELNKLNRQAQQELDKVDNANSKQKLKNFIDSNNALKDQNKMSSLELEIQKAKYDLLIAEMALEDTRNAKSKVRLQRNSEGGYGYVYTADQDAIAEQQQKYEDAQNALYNIGLEHAAEYTNKYASLLKEYYEAVTKLQQDRAAGIIETEEEFQAKMIETQNYYYEMLRQYQDLYAIAVFDTDKHVIEDTWTTQTQMMDNTDIWQATISDYVEQAQDAWIEFKDNVALANDMVGATATETAQKVVGITTETQKMTDYIKGALIPALNDQVSAVLSASQAYAAWRKSIDSALEGFEHTAQRIEDILKKVGLVSDAVNQVEADYEKKQQQSSGAGRDISAEIAQALVEWSENRYGEENDKVYREIVEGLFSERGKKEIGEQYIQQDDLRNIIEGIFGGDEELLTAVEKIADGVNPDNPAGNKVGYMDEEIMNIWKRKIIGLDSGGYTGTWQTDDGKLALLHQKELVLNAQDTENILNTVDIVRQLNSMTGGLPGFGFKAANATSPDSVLQQDVHIDASFPNVSDHNEIELAINNLVNAASQYAMK